MERERLEELVAAGDARAAIAELRRGRRGALPSGEERRLLDVRTHDVMDRAKRKDKWVRVDAGDAAAGYSGEAGGGESRSGFKVVPVERIPVALQRIIVARAVSFALGNPVKYEPDSDTDEAKRVSEAVGRVLSSIKSKSFDRSVARRLFGETEVAEYWYLAEKKNEKYGFPSSFQLRVALWSPGAGDTLYPYFDDTGDMAAFSREYAVEERDAAARVFFETYTDKAAYRWERKSGAWELCDGWPRENAIGKIPVVYARQEETEWAAVQPLIDRLELLLSNFADTNDYHASPKIFVTGNIEGWAQKGDSGAVIQGDDGATMQYVSWNQAPEATRLEIETLLNLIYSLSQTPDISFENVKGIGGISGVALKMLFMDAHLKVKDKAEILDEYFQRRASVVMAYLGHLNKDAKFAECCNTLTLVPELQPYIIEDETTTIANLVTATGNKAIASRRTAVRRLGWVSDADEESGTIEDEENGAVMGDLLDQEPYNVAGGNGE